MVEELLTAAAGTAAAAAAYLFAAARVVKQYERGVVLRLGRLHGPVRPPGFTLVVPGVDRMRKVNLQIVTMPVPAVELLRFLERAQHSAPEPGPGADGPLAAP